MKQDSETINKEITDKVDNLLIKAAKKPNCNNLYLLIAFLNQSLIYNN